MARFCEPTEALVTERYSRFFVKSDGGARRTQGFPGLSSPQTRSDECCAGVRALDLLQNGSFGDVCEVNPDSPRGSEKVAATKTAPDWQMDEA